MAAPAILVKNLEKYFPPARSGWRTFAQPFARGYRSAFLLEILEALFGVATFYYLSRFVESPELSRALPQGSSYFAFALIGFAFFDYLGVALNAFDSGIEEARQNRTLEALLVTQTSLPVMLLSSVIYPFASASPRTVVYISWGIALFGFSVRSANWPGVVLILSASILAFAGLGIFSTSYLLLFKRGNPAKWILLRLTGLLGGMMYPVFILPNFLQVVARLIPITYSFEGMRAALLGAAGFHALWTSILALLIFAVILLPVSFLTFAWALRRTKITGTLMHI